MKNRICAALLALACTLPGGAAAEGEKTFVASFYPMYVFAQNIAGGVPGVTVVNMAGDAAGCLHDYQLQTRDMVTLEKADALIVNGGGMEQFMDKVSRQRPELPVITASEGIEMRCAEAEHAHEHDEAGEALNAHVWLDPELAVVQVQRIADGMAAADAANAAAYQANAAAYIARLRALDAELTAQLAPLAGSPIVTFHEAFTYFADAYGLEVAGVIAGDSGEEPSTRQIAQVCDVVKALNVKALFVEPQYPTRAAETIARETGASIFALDPVVSGDGSPESYENQMRENARVLTEALAP